MGKKAKKKANSPDVRGPGQPTKYTPDMPDRLRSYMKNFEHYGNKLPAKPGFAQSLGGGVHVNTIDNWGKTHPEFLCALRELKDAQHQILLDKGLMGDYNSKVTALVLSHNHGYVVRRDNTSDGKPINSEIKINMSRNGEKASGDLQPNVD